MRKRSDETRIADMRTRLATMATYRTLAHGLTDDRAALLAEAATMIGRVAERMYATWSCGVR